MHDDTHEIGFGPVIQQDVSTNCHICTVLALAIGDAMSGQRMPNRKNTPTTRDRHTTTSDNGTRLGRRPTMIN